MIQIINLHLTHRRWRSINADFIASKYYKQICVALGSLLLTGCYESDAVLVEKNASRIIKFDSLITHNNMTYIPYLNGQRLTLCPFNKKANPNKECSDGYTARFELTPLGNYIIQLKDPNKNVYNYGIWFRSEPNSYAKSNACIVWAGDGLVNNLMKIFWDDTWSSEMSKKLGQPVEMEDPTNKWSYELRDLGAKLKSISSDGHINRPQLIEIVNEYERKIVDYSNTQWQCIGDRVHVHDYTLIQIEGDNRHRMDFNYKHHKQN